MRRPITSLAVFGLLIAPASALAQQSPPPPYAPYAAPPIAGPPYAAPPIAAPPNAAPSGVIAPGPQTTEQGAGPSSLQLGLGITGMALGAAGMFGSVVAALASFERIDQADELVAPIRDQTPQGLEACPAGATSPPECQRVNELADEGETLRNVAIGTGVAGGALLAGSLIYLLIPEGTAERPEVAFSVSGQAAMVQLSGQF